MSKKDINFVKFVKPQVREAEKRVQGMREQRKFNQIRKLEQEIEMRQSCEESRNNEVCKSAAKMGAQERLMNYGATGDSTYLGVGCKWDLLTQWGRDKFGRLL